MDIIAMVKGGNASPFLLLASALLVGALHGLEPGHSKTMMAAFMIAVRGTVGQAVLLGLSATLSHSIIVWVVGLTALFYGRDVITEAAEPWFLMVSGVLIWSVAVWVFLQTWRIRHPGGLSGLFWIGRSPSMAHAHVQGHGHDHGPHHHDHGHDHDHDHHHHHEHEHAGDAHALAHAGQIKRRFSAGRATTGQTIMFGLTGGLIPCPAAITVLILCLNVNQIALGVALVFAFSIGLALTLVTAGVVAALGIRYAAARSPKVDAFLANAPYLSASVIALIGSYFLWSGWASLTQAG